MSIQLGIIIALIAIGILHFWIERDYKKRIAALTPTIDDDIAIYVKDNEQAAHDILTEVLTTFKKKSNLEVMVVMNEVWGSRYLLHGDVSIAMINPTEDEETQVIRRATASFIDETIPLDWSVCIAHANHSEHIINIFTKGYCNGED